MIQMAGCKNNQGLRRWFSAAVDLLLPPRCVACACILPAAGAFCELCWQTVTEIHEACPRCALPGASTQCPACSEDHPPFVWARSAFLYGGQVIPLVHRLKYTGAAHLCRPVAGFLDPGRSATGTESGLPGLLVPVPLHPRQLARRGYNQAGLLAREVSRWTGLPCNFVALERLRDTPSQARLDQQRRRVNVGGAFRAAPSEVRGRRILLVDDVMTTGATARACAAALLEAGAREVAVQTLARAVI